jgi:hypothetical protein
MRRLPLGVPCLHGDSLHPSQEDRLFRPSIRRSLALHLRIKSAATDLQHLTPDGYRPLRLVLSHQGLPQLNSLATQAAAFVNLSRSSRRRVFSSRRRWSSSCAGHKRPFPGKALSSRASCARCQRPRIVALSPKCRAASATP